jgi:very-short-patch-repair endonuclease
LDDAKVKKKVIPYVEDTRNILLLRPHGRLDTVTATSLRYALERGVETLFQLEDSELESTALPDPESRGRMLFTESAEGGAGVLRRLVSEPGALAEVARVALALAHFDPDTAEDLGHASGTTERCERGCYDCLLSFANQSEHALIDRHRVKEPLLEMATAITEAGGEGRGRTATLEALKAACDSDLERAFIDWLEERGLRLPDRAQVHVETARARPDFVYDLPSGPVAVFVDGPVHDGSTASARDVSASERLVNSGWDVVRVPHDGDWDAIVATRPAAFGTRPGARR